VGRAAKRKTTLRKRRQRADWVYRGYEYDEEGGAVLDHETYGNSVFTLSGTTPAAGVLYDSRAYLMESTTRGGGPGAMLKAGRAEGGRRPHIIRVQGYIFPEPTTWAVGSLIEVAFRIGIFEQDIPTGDVITPSIDWTMWNNVGLLPEQSATWANMRRQNLWERRIRRRFSTSNDQAASTIIVNATISAKLNEEECLAIVGQCSGASVDMRGQWWLRSLVVDPHG